MGSEPNIARVASYNSRHGVGPFGLVSHRGLIESCRILDADVLALQELDRHVIRSYFRHQPRLIGRALAMRVATAPTKRTPVCGWQCNAIATRGTLHDVETIELPRVAERERRVALLARVESPGGALSVACTHLDSHGGSAAIDQLQAALEALDRRPAPRLLAGDLNMRPDQAERVLAAAGYQAAETGPTFPAHAPRTRIDWIAVSGGARIAATQVHRPLVGDHRPVVADVVLTGG